MAVIFEIQFKTDAVEHLRAIPKKDHPLILERIPEQLRHRPLLQTRNRKPLDEPNPFGERIWEIRFGPNNRFRVFYQVDEAKRLVSVLAIGTKERNRVFFGNQEVDLRNPKEKP